MNLHTPANGEQLEAYRRLNSGETRPYKFGRRVQAPQSPGAAISVKELEHMPVLDLMPSGSDYGFVNRTMLREFFKAERKETEQK